MSKTPTILAATALLVALFGSTPLGNAAGRMILPKNSVGSAQLKNAAVTGAKVKDGTLAAADFAPGQLPAGQQGPKGDPGAKGDAGAPGAPGLSDYQIVTGPTTTIAGGALGVATATCPAGKHALGGGYATSGAAVFGSDPQSNGTQWLVGANNPGARGETVAAYAVCATVAQ